MGEPNFTEYNRVEQPAVLVREQLDRRDAEAIYFSLVRPRLIEASRRAGVYSSYSDIRTDNSDNESHIDGKRKPRRIRPIRLKKLRELVDRSDHFGIDIDNVNADSESKRSLLYSIMGYKSLRGVVTLADATDAMVGEVFKKDYYQGFRHHHQ